MEESDEVESSENDMELYENRLKQWSLPCLPPLLNFYSNSWQAGDYYI